MIFSFVVIGSFVSFFLVLGHSIGHFTVVYLVAKPSLWSEAEGDLVVLDTSIKFA